MPRGVSLYDTAFIQRRLWTPAVWPSPKLIAWQDASDISSIIWGATAVQQFSDKSGNGKHYTQTTTVANQPGYTSVESVDFNGSAKALNILAGTLATPSASFDYMTVATPLGTAAKNLYFGGTSQSLNWVEVSNLSGVLAGSFVSSGFTVLPGTRTLFYSTMDSAKGVRQSHNGGALTGTLATMTTNAITKMGNTAGGSRQFGSVHEAVMTTNLGLWERQLLEGYLAWKWGITLASGHPYENIPPLIGI